MQLHENDSYWAKNASKFDKHIHSDIEALVKKIGNDIGHVDRVLDVAAGTGVVSLELAKRVRQVDALDLEPKMISVAQKKADGSRIVNISFHVQSAYELDFPDHIFDAIVIMNSLHVMKAPDVALGEARRVIKPTGLLVAPTYCHAETAESLDNYQRWASKSGHKSYYLFTCNSLCALISGCGFEVKKKRTVEIKHERQSQGMMLGYVVASPAPAVS